MGSFRRQAMLYLAVLFVTGPGARAQKDPHIGYLYPAGGQQGTTVEVTVGGQYLNGVADVYVFGEGIWATVVKHTKPPTRREMSDMRMTFRELQKQVRQEKAKRRKGRKPGKPGLVASGTDSTDWLMASEKQIADMRRMYFNPRKQPNPQIAETVLLQVTVAPDAEPGKREVRLKAKAGVSNLLWFQVGPLPEYREAEPNDRVADIGAPVTLPAVLNGQVMPGDADRFAFRARKGNRLVMAASARELIPYLADAVPGWFQAVMTLYDAQGHEVAYADDYRFQPDPVLLFEIPADGTYTLEIRDAIYRGREDFVYRVAVGELPFVTGIFPLGGRAEAKTTVSIQGWHLSRDRQKVHTRGKKAGIHPVAVRHGNGMVSSLFFAVDTLPERVEKEPNDISRRAQRVSLPLIVNGRIDRPGDWDVFRFKGRADEEVVAEVHARRLNSPLDSVLRLTDETGRELAINDDHEDRGAGLITHHADSHLRFRLPASGTYYLYVGDTQNRGGRSFAYRLRVSPPRPDYALRTVPASLNIHAGTTLPITVYALRKDGFSGEIGLELVNPPPGFALSGGGIPAGQDRVRLTLTAPPRPLEAPVNLYLRGRAVIRGQAAHRMAVPAEEMTQAFVNRHLVSAEALMTSVTTRRRSTAQLRPLGKRPVRLNPGQTTRVRIRAPRKFPLGEVRLELNDPPEGVSLQTVGTAERRINLVLQADAEKVQPGLKGNLIVDAFLVRQVTPKDGTSKTRTRRVPLGVLPAIPFEIAQR